MMIVYILVGDIKLQHVFEVVEKADEQNARFDNEQRNVLLKKAVTSKVQANLAVICGPDPHISQILTIFHS